MEDAACSQVGTPKEAPSSYQLPFEVVEWWPSAACHWLTNPPTTGLPSLQALPEPRQLLPGELRPHLCAPLGLPGLRKKKGFCLSHRKRGWGLEKVCVPQTACWLDNTVQQQGAWQYLSLMVPSMQGREGSSCASRPSTAWIQGPPATASHHNPSEPSNLLFSSSAMHEPVGDTTLFHISFKSALKTQTALVTALCAVDIKRQKGRWRKEAKRWLNIAKKDMLCVPTCPGHSDAESTARVVKEHQSPVDADRKYLHLKPFPKFCTEILGGCTAYTHNALQCDWKWYSACQKQDTFVNEKEISMECLHLL